MEKPSPFGAREMIEPVNDYVGFRNPPTKPRRLTTQPNLRDLVTFVGRERENYREWKGPKLRTEIMDGKVQFRIVIDGERLVLKLGSINKVQRTLNNDWLETNLADLYFRGEYGRPISRQATGQDPATVRK